MTSPYATPGSPYYSPQVASGITADGAAQVGSSLRYASTDPLPGDLRVTRAPDGRSDAVMQATVVDPEHLAEVARRRAADDGGQE